MKLLKYSLLLALSSIVNGYQYFDYGVGTTDTIYIDFSSKASESPFKKRFTCSSANGDYKVESSDTSLTISNDNGSNMIITSKFDVLYGTFSGVSKAGAGSGTLTSFKVSSSIAVLALSVASYSKSSVLVVYYGKTYKTVDVGVDLTSGFYEYSIEITKDQIVYGVNGKTVATLTKDDAEDLIKGHYPSTPASLNFMIEDISGNTSGSNVTAYIEEIIVKDAVGAYCMVGDTDVTTSVSMITDKTCVPYSGATSVNPYNLESLTVAPSYSTAVAISSSSSKATSTNSSSRSGFKSSSNSFLSSKASSAKASSSSSSSSSSSISTRKASSSSSAKSSTTDIVSTVLKSTSCSSSVCSTHAITTGIVVVTSTNEDLVTSYTTYCPLTNTTFFKAITTSSSSSKAASKISSSKTESSSSSSSSKSSSSPTTKAAFSSTAYPNTTIPVSTKLSSSTVWDVVDKSTVVTVTSCKDNACSTSHVITGVVVVTSTSEDIVTSYTTYCPLSSAASSSYSAAVTNSSSSRSVISGSTSSPGVAISTSVSTSVATASSKTTLSSTVSKPVATVYASSPSSTSNAAASSSSSSLKAAASTSSPSSSSTTAARLTYVFSSVPASAASTARVTDIAAPINDSTNSIASTKSLSITASLVSSSSAVALSTNHYDTTTTSANDVPSSIISSSTFSQATLDAIASTIYASITNNSFNNTQVYEGKANYQNMGSILGVTVLLFSSLIIVG